MSYLVTMLLTLAVVVVAMWVFIKVGTPVYRLDRDNVIALLELVLSGRATENDWHVFIGIPLRHDSALREVQKHCEQLAETEYTGHEDSKLFTARGLAELEVVLLKLKAEAKHEAQDDSLTDRESELAQQRDTNNKRH